MLHRRFNCCESFPILIVRIDSSIVESWLLFLSLFISERTEPGLSPGGGGGVLPYMGYIGMCRGIGYVFLGSRSLNRVSLLFLLALCSRCDP